MFSALLVMVLMGGVTANNYTGVLVVTMDSCPACKRMEPTVKKLVVQGEPIIVTKIKTQNDIEGTVIRLVPAILIYKDGKEIGRETGFHDEAGLRACVQKTRTK